MESIYSDSFDQKSSQKALDMDHRKKSISILVNTMRLYLRVNYNLTI